MEKKKYLISCASCLINAGEVGLFSRWISSLPLLDIMIPRATRNGPQFLS